MKYTPHQKIVPYQRVINLQREIKTLESFDSYFQSLLAYFEQSPTHNPQQINQGYLISRTILAEFYQEYQRNLGRFKKEFQKVKSAKAIKPVPLEK